jgi:hypothetical protein
MKILHISFHKGCINDINYICKHFGIECEILSQSHEFNTNKDIQSLWESNNQHYNITHDRAKKYWDRYKDYFEQFDCIITSDTAPLSRIFLQNNWQKKLIIWICNRFDYTHREIPVDFPDKEYYDLFRKATQMPNVYVIGYTKYENIYCEKFGINVNNVIQPSGGISNVYNNLTKNSELNNKLFVVPYHNETKMMNLVEHIQNMKIDVAFGRYNGPIDLLNYKAIIHIPYAVSNLALFEIFQIGLVYFIPSFKFLLELFNTHKTPFFQIPLGNPEIIEWYNPEFKDAFIYFDSWDDFKQKYESLDYAYHKQKVLELGKKHMNNVLSKWKNILYTHTKPLFIAYGHKLYSHTHSYIHFGYVRAFEALGWNIAWYDDNDNIDISLIPKGTIFLTTGGVDSRIPILPDCFYILHNVDSKKYDDIPNSNKLILQVHCHGCDYNINNIKISEASMYIPQENVLYTIWATDLLPEEINIEYALENYKNKKKSIVFIGSFNNCPQFGNYNQIMPFVNELQKSGYNWEQYTAPFSTPVENGMQKKIISGCEIAPAIVGHWQQSKGYIPCRIFKSISYGCIGITNSKYVHKLLHEQCVFNEDSIELAKLSRDFLQKPLEEIHDILRKQMQNVKEHHTYINRVKDILTVLKEFKNYI